MQMLTAVGTLCIALCVPLLYVGLFGDLIWYQFTVKLFGQSLTVLENERTLLGKGGLVSALMDQEAYVAAFCLVFFGALLPLMKLILFCVWLSGMAASHTMERALLFAQRMSKWAAVDAICEAIIVGMLLKVPMASARHDVAYLSFIGYCILSTIAFHCLPGDIAADDALPSKTHLYVASKMKCPRTRATVLVGSLTVFLMLLAIGGGGHSVRLWIPKERMRANLDDALGNNANPLAAAGLAGGAIRRQIEEAVANMKEINSQVSLSGCIHRLIGSGKFYTMLGSILLFACIVILPVVYAVLSAAKALSMTDLGQSVQNGGATSSTAPAGHGADGGMGSIPEDESVKKLSLLEAEAPWWGPMDQVRTFARDLSMLDVMVVGMWMGSMISNAEKDLKSQLEPSFWALAAAAVAWHGHNFLCGCVQASRFVDGEEEPGAEPGAEPAF